MQVEQSRLGVLVGQDYEGDGVQWAKFHVHFTAEKAQKQLEMLQALVGGQLDLEWSVVGSLSYMPGQAHKLEQGIQKFYEKTLKEEEEFVVKTSIGDNRVFVSMKAIGEFEAEFLEPFQMFYNQGLEQIATQQQNTIHGQISSNAGFPELLSALQAGDRLLSVILKSVKLELNAQLSSGLADKVKDLIQNFDPEFANEPPMVLFKHFKSFDIDLRFKGTDDLPETIKKRVLFGKKLSNMDQNDRVMPDDERVPHDVFDALGDEHEFWFTIPNFVAVHVKVKLPNLSQLVKEYGWGILNSL